MEENFASRLKFFMDSIGVASSQFADSCEIPRPSFSQLLSGRNQKVSDLIIRKIHSAYPDLSITWLLFGEGAMTSSSDNNSEETENTDENPKEISENLNIRPENSDISILKGLTMPENHEKTAVIQQLEENKKIIELQMQIENLQKNPRKVTQITLYYDDSTFETFIPTPKTK